MALRKCRPIAQAEYLEPQMGITGLWDLLLKCEGALVPLYGNLLLESIVGARIAIDASRWIVEAHTAVGGTGVPRKHAHSAVLIWRTTRLLRLGVVPLIVFDGVAPKEKSVGNRGLLKSASKHGKEIAAALGVVSVIASGEAEATCALLNARGDVRFCDTRDGDALVFGARSILKDLSIQADICKSSAVLCEAETIFQALGVYDREGIAALTLLLGSDFNAGVHGIGWKKALRFVKIAAAHCDDQSLMQNMLDIVFERDAEADDLLGSLKTKSSCLKDRSLCPCEFHRLADDIYARKISHLILKECPDYQTQWSIVCKQFLEPVKVDMAPVGLEIEWRHRPDVERVAFLMDQPPDKVLKQLLPTLLAWDLQQCSTYPGGWRGSETKRKHGFKKWALDNGIEYVAVGIKTLRAGNMILFKWEAIHPAQRKLLASLTAEQRSIHRSFALKLCPDLVESFDTGRSIGQTALTSFGFGPKKRLSRSAPPARKSSTSPPPRLLSSSVSPKKAK